MKPTIEEVKMHIKSFHGITGSDVQPIIDWYNTLRHTTYTINTPWCAMFLGFALVNHLIGIPVEASCDTLKNDFKKLNLWRNPATYHPRDGDLIFFSNVETEKNCTHVGYVYSVNGTNIITYEGNTSKMVAPRIYEEGDPYIVGFADLRNYYKQREEF